MGRAGGMVGGTGGGGVGNRGGGWVDVRWLGLDVGGEVYEDAGLLVVGKGVGWSVFVAGLPLAYHAGIVCIVNDWGTVMRCRHTFLWIDFIGVVLPRERRRVVKVHQLRLTLQNFRGGLVGATRECCWLDAIQIRRTIIWLDNIYISHE